MRFRNGKFYTASEDRENRTVWAIRHQYVVRISFDSAGNMALICPSFFVWQCGKYGTNMSFVFLVTVWSTWH